MFLGVPMSGKKMVAGGVFLFCVALLVASLPQRAASHGGQETGPEQVPAYHAESPKNAIPATLSPTLFDNVVVQNAYLLAARVKKLLYQQPCYCHCDRSQGHGSLLDCFAGKHAAECQVCIREGFYTYEQSRKGKTAAQIRDGIERGEWRQVDVSKYAAAISAK
jgi:Protein of unknown function with PCYCGC motif